MAASRSGSAEGTDTTEAATESGGTVKYTGDAGTREIGKADWVRAGVNDQDKVVWDADNDYTLPKSNFSADALEVLKRDKNLKIS